MKIGGFEIGKKHIIVVGAIVGVIAIASAVSNHSKQEELQKRIEEENQRMQQAQNNANSNTEVDEDELEKQQLIKQYGNPPEGFMWNDDGELYALSDDKKTAEEVVYTYIRSLSIQDFSSAQKCAKKSQVVKSYNRFYDDATDANYYSLFLRKQYKFAITSIEIVGVEDSAVFADGSTMVTMKVNVLDLTNKDFWQSRKAEIYQKLRDYKQTEEDSTKADQYLYDLIYKCYEDGVIGKKEVVVSFKLSKEYGSGWLIEDDSELNHYLLYEEGVDVVPYIKECYATWLEETLEKEQDAKERAAERAEKKLEERQAREEAAQSKKSKK